MRGDKFIDPCLFGQTQNLSAAVYADLAVKHPEIFQPLEAGNQSLVSLKHATKSAASHAAPEYHYVWLGGETAPPDFLFIDPTALTNDSRVYGTAYPDSDETLMPHVAVFEDGIWTVLQEGFAITANQGGTVVGGWVLTDPDNFNGQAALFRRNEVKLIPRLPGEIHSEVVQVNDSGAALIRSLDEAFTETMALYYRGRMIPLDFGPDIPVASFLSMNNRTIISGTTFIDGLGFRGFRFDPRTGLATLLNPLPTEPHAWALGINNRGDTLGYSFVSGGIERIGVWDANGNFHTRFVEGIPEFPTISNSLKFNDKNEIVITRVTKPPSERHNSYLLRKGVRLNLADLVEDMPPEHGLLEWVGGINNYGNMFGSTFTPDFPFSEAFLLERIGAWGE